MGGVVALGHPVAAAMVARWGAIGADGAVALAGRAATSVVAVATSTAEAATTTAEAAARPATATATPIAAHWAAVTAAAGWPRTITPAIRYAGGAGEKIEQEREYACDGRSAKHA